MVFETNSKNARELKTRIEAALHSRLGYEAAAFLRTGSQLREIVGYKPFPKSKLGPKATVHVIFMDTPLERQSSQNVKALRTEFDEYRELGREIYWLRSRKPGASPYTTIPLEKALRTPFTIRSQQTVMKIYSKYFPGV